MLSKFVQKVLRLFLSRSVKGRNASFPKFFKYRNEEGWITLHLPLEQGPPILSSTYREGFHRLSMRSRFPLVRSNTMGKEEEDKVKRMNLGQRNTPLPSPGTPSRPKLLTRANTTLDGSQSPASILKTSRSKVVCRSAKKEYFNQRTFSQLKLSVLVEMCWEIKWRKWREATQ